MVTAGSLDLLFRNNLHSKEHQPVFVFSIPSPHKPTCPTMDVFVLKAKHYQIFFSLVSGWILAAFIPNYDINVYLIKVVLITLPYILWVFTLGRSLNQCLPVRKRLSETLLIFNLFFFCVVYALIIIFIDGRIYFHGWAVLIPLYLIYSFIYLFYFTSKALTSAESGNRAPFGEHIGEMVMLLLGYLGLWYIQPRINKLYELHKDKFEENEEEHD